MSKSTRLKNRNATLFVYEDRQGDVVPPFLVGEIAGSLALESDRTRLREFAVSVLHWLEQTEIAESNVVRDVPFGQVRRDNAG